MKRQVFMGAKGKLHYLICTKKFKIADDWLGRYVNVGDTATITISHHTPKKHFSIWVKQGGITHMIHVTTSRLFGSFKPVYE